MNKMKDFEFFTESQSIENLSEYTNIWACQSTTTKGIKSKGNPNIEFIWMDYYRLFLILDSMIFKFNLLKMSIDLPERMQRWIILRFVFFSIEYRHEFVGGYFVFVRLLSDFVRKLCSEHYVSKSLTFHKGNRFPTGRVTSVKISNLHRNAPAKNVQS